MEPGEILVKNVKRRSPFRLEKLPWIVRIYRYPINRWPSHGKQALFGVFNVGLFFAYQRLVPVVPKGWFSLECGGTSRRVWFDGRNTQFQALYLSCWGDGYEPEVSALLDIIVPANGVFYDIGSNWGYLSLWVATRPDFRGKIHAFEPFPSTFRDLRSVVEQAGLRGPIEPHNQALSDRDGTTNMHIPDWLHSGWATMDDDAGSGTRNGQIPMTTLDSLQLEPPAVIKIDAERAEAKILKGGKKLIAHQHPLIIFESFRNVNQPEVTLEPFWILRDAGYVFFRPAWLRETDGHSYLLSSDTPFKGFPEEKLALVPLNPEDRFLCPDLQNIFACHADSLPDLRKRFEPRHL